MDEQATERELERDEFVQEIKRLQEVLKDKDRDRSSQQHMNHEVMEFILQRILHQHMQNITILQSLLECTDFLLQRHLSVSIMNSAIVCIKFQIRKKLFLFLVDIIINISFATTPLLEFIDSSVITNLVFKNKNKNISWI